MVKIWKSSFSGPTDPVFHKKKNREMQIKFCDIVMPSETFVKPSFAVIS